MCVYFVYFAYFVYFVYFVLVVGGSEEALEGAEGPIRSNDFDFSARRFLGELRVKDKAEGTKPTDVNEPTGSIRNGTSAEAC